MTKQHLDRLQAWRLKIIQHAQNRDISVSCGFVTVQVSRIKVLLTWRV
jgi:hypothetical protein